MYVCVCLLQATEYHEKVTKPKEDAKLEKKEEEFYKFKGPAWKGKADRLGVGLRGITLKSLHSQHKM